MMPQRAFACSLLLVVFLRLTIAAAQEPPPGRILFGSCIKQDQEMPILQTIVQREPDLFIFLGDNIYADTTDMDLMRAKYATLKANPTFSELWRSVPTLAIWDDHDYGANDAGAEYPEREQSQQIFVDFWDDDVSSPRRQRPGIYDAKILGPQGRRVQIILLDTRYFRGPLKKGPQRLGGPYVPAEDPSITMLGEAQWQWLREQLLVPAELRIIASGIQCVSQDAGHETWSNLPHQRQQLFDLIAETEAGGVLMISGDRHWAELSVAGDAVPYPIYDLTSSSLNQIHPRGTPTENRYRALPTTFHRENFGEILVHWDQDDPQIQLRILDIDGQVQLEKQLSAAELRVKP